jgi:fibronectin type 3 domain-containing protein
MKKSLLLLFALLVSATSFAQESLTNAPENVEAIAIDDTKIKLIWSFVGNESTLTYNVYLEDTLITNIADSTCIINGLTPETEYCFSVATVLSGIEYEKSEEVCATTFYTCPIPQNVKVNVVLNDPNYGKKYKITCKWDAVENVDGYAVYIATQYYPEGMWMSNVTTTEFVIGSDVDGEMFISIISICDAELGNASDRSEEVGVILNEEIIEDVSAMKAPANLTATAKSTSSIELTWDDVENAMSYFVYRNDVEIANITGTTYVDENLAYDTEYCYTVTAMGSSSESDPSEEACTKTLGESLAENTSLFNIFPNPATDNLSIEANEEITEVNIYNIIGVNVYNEQCTMNNLQLDINISDFNSGVYFVKVKSLNGETVKRFIKQ